MFQHTWISRLIMKLSLRGLSADAMSKDFELFFTISNNIPMTGQPKKKAEKYIVVVYKARYYTEYVLLSVCH